MWMQHSIGLVSKRAEHRSITRENTRVIAPYDPSYKKNRPYPIYSVYALNNAKSIRYTGSQLIIGPLSGSGDLARNQCFF